MDGRVTPGSRGAVRAPVSLANRAVTALLTAGLWSALLLCAAGSMLLS